MDRRSDRRALLCCALCLVPACGDLDSFGRGDLIEPGSPSPDEGDLAEEGEVGESHCTVDSAVVGPEGGTVILCDVVITMPPGALAARTELSVNVVESAMPGWLAASSPIYFFQPAGLELALSATVTIPLSDDPEMATIFWSSLSTGAFVTLPTTLGPEGATAEIDHLGKAFVGSGCSGEDCCSPANGRLDVLLVVDDSNSMEEEQRALADQLERMSRALGTGDLDGDGEQDFPALESVRIGVVSSDMGSGGYDIVTCHESGDGSLRTEGSPDVPGCAASYPSFAELDANGDEEATQGFVEHVKCVARRGTGGCGFEQPLEAALKALTPSSSSVRFEGGATGHGDGRNAGFLRDDSILAVIVLTDEDDCSMQDTTIMDPMREELVALNLRCFANPEAMHPTSRYLEGFRALRQDSADVLFGAIVGVPADLVMDAEDVDYDAILGDARMTPAVATGADDLLTPSCESDGGLAYPPRRIVELAEAFEGAGVVQSICQSDFTPAVEAILERVAARARGECL